MVVILSALCLFCCLFGFMIDDHGGFRLKVTQIDQLDISYLFY